MARSYGLWILKVKFVFILKGKIYIHFWFYSLYFFSQIMIYRFFLSYNLWKSFWFLLLDASNVSNSHHYMMFMRLDWGRTSRINDLDGVLDYLSTAYSCINTRISHFYSKIMLSINLAILLLSKWTSVTINLLLEMRIQRALGITWVWISKICCTEATGTWKVVWITD